MERATDLSNRYWNMATADLRRLKSQKVMRITKLEAKRMGYFDIQEVRKLQGHLRWINAVLAAREARLTLGL